MTNGCMIVLKEIKDGTNQQIRAAAQAWEIRQYLER